MAGAAAAATGSGIGGAWACGGATGAGLAGSSAALGGAEGAAGGLTTVTATGGTTATAGRGAVTAPAGALATTGVEGGLEAIAGAEGGTDTIGGAWRTGGMIFRGSGRAGAAGGCATATTGGAGLAGACCGVAATAGFTGAWLRRAAISSSCFFARIAFSASPGLEICERSIFGCRVCWPRNDPLEPCAERLPPRNCVRTRSASSASRELECVLPSPRPSSTNTSRICRLLTSISRARSLIRTLLIRLFSMSATKSPKCS
jgi:hypothetical protein